MEEDPTLGDGAFPPRRLLRKGTRSCVECKRRKTRCFFDHAAATECVGCYRRGTRCIGQEFVDISAPDSVGDRLKQVERKLETVLNRFSTSDAQRQRLGCGGQPGRSEHVTEVQGYQADDDDASTSEGDPNLTVVEQPSESPIVLALHTQTRTATQKVAEEPARSIHIPVPSHKYSATCQALFKALPSQEDSNILFGTGRSTIFIQALCNPYYELFDQGNIRPSATMSVLPPVTAHPVLLARKMLQLALCIQQLDSSFDRSVLHLGEDLTVAMHKYIQLASDMVTCHDDLLSSLEGLECLVYEGVFHINCGNLRRGLACLRRASTMAQFMGLHRRGPIKPPKRHDPETSFSVEVAWAHVAYLERYVSLLLGMPTSITGAQFASEKTPGETDSQWFEKWQIGICEHIIRRNQPGDYNVAATEEIDRELNKMASSLPAKWWTPMDLRPGMRDQELMSQIIDAQMQINHFNMLTVLHLPFLLRHDPDRRFDYNKATCMYASREVLNRFITFRAIVQVVFCCRPVDFCAFTAILTLLLAHLVQPERLPGSLSTHQRLGDRALIEKTVDTLEVLSRLNGDELTRETVQLARRLLDLEADSSRSGETYTCSISPLGSDMVDAGGSVHAHHQINVPYFGAVKLERRVHIADRTAGAAWDSAMGSASSEAALTLGDDTEPSFPSMSSEQLSASAQVVVAQASVMLGEHATCPLPLPRYTHNAESHDPLVSQSGVSNGADPLEPVDLDMPDFMADADTWAFQGVDTAFFDSLLGGNWANGVGWGDSWPE